MADARLTFTIDTAPGIETGQRVQAAIADALKTARATGQPIDDEALTGLAASAVVAELMRVVPSPLAAVEAERDGAYRERAQLVAHLASIYPSHIGYTDPSAPDWAVVIVQTPTGQMSWHVAPRDTDLFEHVPHTRPGLSSWDGHTTEQKYQRLRALTLRAKR